MGFIADDLVLPSGRVPAGSTVIVVLVGGVSGGETAGGAATVEAMLSGSFGHGHHRCPARGFAPHIVDTAVAHAWRGFDEPAALAVIGYRESINVRIPIFGRGE